MECNEAKYKAANAFNRFVNYSPHCTRRYDVTMAGPKRTSLTDEKFRLISRALGDPRRHEILQQIGEAKKSLPCCQMLGELCISAPTLSHHMRELETAGLVEATRAGKFVSYTLRRDVLQAYIERLAKI